MDNRSSLGFLGEDYQYRLVHEFMEDKNCFKDLAPIIDQNMFTSPSLKLYVGLMLEYLNKYNSKPSYAAMEVAMRQKAHTEIDREMNVAIVNKIRNTPSDGSEQTRELATKFFKQQNIIKAANEMLKLAGNGEIDNYDKCEELLRNALNSGTHEDYEESRLFDGIDDVLSDDFRIVIPTGIGKIDESLNGGLGKGELGVIIGPSSFGKALSVNEVAVTPSGYKKMGELKVGDKVIGSDGKAHNIVGVFPQGKRDIYKVTFSDGTTCRCDMEHLWAVNRNKVKTLREIVEDGLFNGGKQTKHKYKIPITEPVEFDEIPILVDPYLMGHSISEARFEQRDEFIHHDYLFNSLENRIALLNGLMDTNGTCSKSGNCSYVTTSRRLADEVRTLVLSLGGVSSIITNGSVYKVEIQLCDPTILVFRLESKQKLVKYRTESKKCKFFEKVEFDCNEEAVCIKVDAEDELYLTNDFIVTHNTSLTTAMALHACTHRCQQNSNQGFKVMQIVFEDRIKQIQRKHFSHITQTEACNLSKEEYAQHVREILDKYPDKELAQENLRIIRLPSGKKTMWDIETIIKSHINNGFRPDLVIVDYFEAVRHKGDSSMSKYDKEELSMRKVESMANELDIAFWVPVQGNRDSINSEIVTMDQGGGAIQKIQIAHIIMTIARTMEDIADNLATVSIVKNRAGQAGKVFDGVMFNNGTCTISTDSVDEYANSVSFGKHRDELKEEKERDLTKEIFKQVKR